VRLPEECRFDGKVAEARKEGSARSSSPWRSAPGRRGFWERLLAMAPEVNREVPERLPSNPYREAVLDELARD
jgi:hypothetical protein